MACLFAVLGAEVWALDACGAFRAAAEDEASKWDVSERVHFLYGEDARLDGLPDESFDLVFTKSVLVLFADLDGILARVSRTLRRGGKVVFLENAYGNLVFQALRKLRHRKWRFFGEVAYFKQEQLATIAEHFEVALVRESMVPPAYLICGSKR